MKIKPSDLKLLLTIMEGKNLSVSDVINLINGHIANKKPLESTDKIILVVDYTKTLEQTIAGKYGYKNTDITTEHFPISPELTGKRIDIIGRLFHFNRDISRVVATKEMNEAGCRHATLMELLALSAAHPDLQRQFPIVALGSAWCFFSGIHRVPYLDFSDNVNQLFLNYLEFAWPAHYRFLGVVK
jgi:hypothetical protein